MALPEGAVRAFSEPYAFVLITWPAAALAAHLTDSGNSGHSGWTIAALSWLTFFHVTAALDPGEILAALPA